MPSATLSLSRLSLVWRRGQATRLSGYCVLSAVAYDGTAGLVPIKATAPIPFRRRPRQDCELIRPNVAGVGDDGLLLATLRTIPRALGWAMTATLTETQSQAQRVMDTTLDLATSLASAIPGGNVASGVLAAGKSLSSALGEVLGARVAGTWINSESDPDDLQRSWCVSHENFKTLFELSYEVRSGRRTSHSSGLRTIEVFERNLEIRPPFDASD